MTDDGPAAPPSENEVRAVIQKFWSLDADKAHVADFLPIMDDDFFIRAVDGNGDEAIRFDGLAGLEDHQEGKMDLFDEQFQLSSIDCTIAGDRAVARTTAQWTFRHRAPRAPHSKLCRGDLEHEWYVRRHPERGTVVVTGHTCTRLTYRPGQAPPVPAAREDVQAASRSIHLDPERYLGRRT